MGYWITTPGGKRYRLSAKAERVLADLKLADLKAAEQPARRGPNHLYFSESEIARLKPKRRQYLVWDAWPVEGKRQRGPDPARGLCVLVSPRGSKSYRVVFYFPGSPKPVYKHLGRVGEISLSEARARANEARRLAREGIDPRADDPTSSDSFEAVFKDWVAREQIGRRQNKSARKTESFVLANCAALKGRPVATIRYSEIEALLDRIRDGDGAKQKPRAAAAIRLYAHLRDFFGWCARRDGPIKTSPLTGMSAPAAPAVRNRVYSPAELTAIWRAADALDNPAEGAYTKLMMLVALRREELARARWSEFDSAETPTMLTVPFERTKGKATRAKKIVYRVPLVPLAQRILAGLPRHGGDAAVFPGLDAERLKAKLVRHGAPKDFRLHTFRHSVATWLENAGRSEWERGLVLNHSSWTVTSGYSHGHASDLKRTLLEEWAGYIEGLVAPAGVALLR